MQARLRLLEQVVDVLPSLFRPLRVQLRGIQYREQLHLTFVALRYVCHQGQGVAGLTRVVDGKEQLVEHSRGFRGQAHSLSKLGACPILSILPGAQWPHSTPARFPVVRGSTWAASP